LGMSQRHGERGELCLWRHGSKNRVVAVVAASPASASLENDKQSFYCPAMTDPTWRLDRGRRRYADDGF
jgi:hypothetical protein